MFVYVMIPSDFAVLEMAEIDWKVEQQSRKSGEPQPGLTLSSASSAISRLKGSVSQRGELNVAERRIPV
jgi:hypothetical protein